MVFIDPDGEFFVPFLIGAGIGVLSNGVINSLEDRPFFSGAFKSAIIGGVGGAFSFGIGEIAETMSGFGKLAFQAGTHGHLGGMMSGFSGGDYGSGFLSGAFGTLVGHGVSDGLLKDADVGYRVLGGVAAGTISGGFGSWVAGGDFVMGMRNGAISSVLNNGAHLMKNIWDDGMGGEPIEQQNQASEEFVRKVLFYMAGVNNASGTFSGLLESYYLSKLDNQKFPLNKAYQIEGITKGKLSFLKTVGKYSFRGAVFITGIQAARGDISWGKAGLDISMGAAMYKGNWQLKTIGAGYFLMDAYGWDNAYRDYKTYFPRYPIGTF